LRVVVSDLEKESVFECHTAGMVENQKSESDVRFGLPTLRPFSHRRDLRGLHTCVQQR
jgi:hypothetical protein